MSSEQHYILTDEYREQVKADYCEETGEELPDHVVNNLHLFVQKHPSELSRIDERLRQESKPYGAVEEDDDTSAAELCFTLAWTAGTGLAALYATKFIAGSPGAQIAGGVLLWAVLFSVPLLIIAVVNEAAEGWFGD